MSDPHCAIRFTDPAHTVAAHIVRDCFGHSEDVLSNLSHLSRVVHELPCQPAPGTIAAQFVVIDSLVMAYREREPEQMYDDMMGLVQNGPKEDRERDFLCHHSIGTNVDADARIWCYEVGIRDDSPEWFIRISEPTEGAANTDALFEDVSWQYEGSLADALAKLE